MIEKSVAKRLIMEYQQMVAGVELTERDKALSGSMNCVLVGLRRAGKSYLLYQQVKALMASPWVF